MRFKDILGCAAALAVMTLSQSCLKDQQDIFDKTASARMQEFLENARTVLTGAEYGWKMEYFTNYGGYNYALQFKDGKVTASNEMHPGETETTYFKLTTTDGPVLSFDTNSDMLHFFATPSSNEYEGKGGDFEFIILSAAPEEVVLKGVRTGYMARLYPLTESVADYTTSIANVIKGMLVLGFECDFEGDKSWSGRFDLMERMVIFGQYDQDGVVKGEELSENFIYTETGVKLYEPLDVNGYSFQTFKVDNVPGIITTDNDKAVITAKAIPAEYIRFEQIAGNYTLKIGRDSYDIELRVYDEFAREFEIFGLNGYQLFMSYDVNTGNISIEPQFVHAGEEVILDGDYYLTLFAITSDYHYSLSSGMNGVWDGKSLEKPVFKFESQSQLSRIIGFSLAYYEPNDGDLQEYSGDLSPVDFLPFTSMTKK